MPPRRKTAQDVRQAREQQIRRHVKAGARVPPLAWWYHHTEAEMDDVIRRSHFPLLEDAHANEDPD